MLLHPDVYKAPFFFNWKKACWYCLLIMHSKFNRTCSYANAELNAINETKKVRYQKAGRMTEAYTWKRVPVHFTREPATVELSWLRQAGLSVYWAGFSKPKPCLMQWKNQWYWLKHCWTWHQVKDTINNRTNKLQTKRKLTSSAYSIHEPFMTKHLLFFMSSLVTLCNVQCTT